jgi:membrane glycosyltransferase
MYALGDRAELRAVGRVRRRPPRGRNDRALALAGLVLSLSLAATGLFWEVIRAEGVTPAEQLALVLFMPLFGSLTFTFLVTGAGFLRGFAARPSTRSTLAQWSPRAATPSRVALVMVVRHEVVTRVQAGLRAIYQSLAATGSMEPYTFFLLSDSTDLAVGAAEERAVHALTEELGATGRVRYRRRAENHGRKSGNLADFCMRWGTTFDYMIVLDADSVLDGATIRELVHRMDRQPRIGILQLPIRPVNGGSLFARIQQFAASTYGPLATEGIAFWLGNAAPYWGHNAIIRVAPFMQHCRLPRLPGREPLGGEILSHDFVEAALMRGAGWDVHVASDLGGSYEEVPPNLVAHAARDRRWCQGNLQHVRLLFAPTFALASRLTLAVGALSYLCGPAWVLFVVAISLSPSVPALVGFTETLPPAESSLARVFGVTLIVLTLSFLVLPKVFALIRLGLTPGAVALRGGWGPVVASLALESLFAVLVTPILLTFQAAFVVAVLSGSSAGWNVQARGEAALSVGAAFRAHGLQTLGGLAAAALLFTTDSPISLWLLPSLVGLWVAIPLSAVTSRADWALRARRCRLFLIPEELAPSPVLQALTASPQTSDPAWRSGNGSHVSEAAA